MTLDEMIRRTTMRVDDALYIMVKIPPQHVQDATRAFGRLDGGFTALIAAHDEITLILPNDSLSDLELDPSLVTISTIDFRLITFEMVFDFDVVGFMARISAVLAAAQVPIFPVAAYSTDHLLVPSTHFDLAVAELKKLMESS